MQLGNDLFSEEEINLILYGIYLSWMTPEQEKTWVDVREKLYALLKKKGKPQ